MDQEIINIIWCLAWPAAIFSGLILSLHWFLIMLAFYAGAKIGPGATAKLLAVLIDEWFFLYNVLLAASVYFIVAYW